VLGDVEDVKLMMVVAGYGGRDVRVGWKGYRMDVAGDVRDKRCEVGWEGMTTDDLRFGVGIDLQVQRVSRNICVYMYVVDS
jgi:hypothetical protein